MTDINECSEKSSGCTQMCTNTVGSFTCHCNIGYYLLADGRTCNGKFTVFNLLYAMTIDINECATNNGGCEQLCYNEVGYHYCKCSPGYQLNADNFSCVGMFYNFKVKCDVSYIDIDECSTNTSNCNQLCNNTVGGYTCGCNTGYKLASDNRTCSGK